MSSPVSDTRTALLRCPRTKQGVHLASPAELAKLARAVPDPPEQAVVTDDGVLAYPIIHDIYVLLEDRAMVMNGMPQSHSPLNPEKLAVQRFYDETGWQRGDSRFFDSELFADSRAVSAEYDHRALERVARQLGKGGSFLLDAASGAVPHAGYLEFSRDYETRICVDFSIEALIAAQAKLGSKAMCVLADVTNLPFRSDALDAAISLHTIYHVPADQQEQAFLELYRVIRPGAEAVVIYSWGKLRLHQVLRLPFTIRRLLRHARGRETVTETAVRDLLYYSGHSYKWFTQRNWPFCYELKPWSTIGPTIMEGYIPDNRFGLKLLRALYFLEERFPDTAARWGQYPLIVIPKPDDGLRRT